MDLGKDPDMDLDMGVDRDVDRNIDRDVDEAARLLSGGGVLLYPTETLYALGCAATHAAAAARVAALKGRPQAKPFPLVVADFAGVLGLTAPLDTAELAGLRADLTRLAEVFWPGPLSVLLPTRPGLPALVRDEAGYSSVRVSPHPTVQKICRALASRNPEGCGALVATSANRSGQPAAATPEQLDPVLLAAVTQAGGGALLAPPWPAGGPPSTLIRLTGPGRAKVLRLGATSLEALSQVFALD